MHASKALRVKKSKHYGAVDRSLIFIVLFLIVFGLIMIYSASAYSAVRAGENSDFYLKNQFVHTLLGLVVMFVVSRIDYHLLRKFAWAFYFVPIILILLVLTPLGMTINGARRWLRVGVSLQPAEVAKLGMIIFFAAYVCGNLKRVQHIKGIMQTMALAGFPALLVYSITDNLSSAIIIFAIIYVMLFVASPRSLPYVAVAGGLVAIAAFVVFIVAHNIIPAEMSYRLGRIEAWLNPEAFASGRGFQTLQALYSIGSGGILGKGLGQSTQKLGFVPEAQNDMIFSIICEELGMFGALAVILLFVMLIYHLLIIATNAQDLFGSLLVTGVMTHFALQVLLNIAVVTNALPNTGITLPFISYGGSSSVFLLAEIGVTLSVSRSMKAE
ncbi:MAG: putative lipid II flippase FtsW [Lachnospiraceae bacterium]|nr:putative lipid II flippase FtsW [Lachnospiraceae bacterium]